MILKYLISLLFIGFVSALSTFIDKGNRAELFELTDNEVAIFNVTIPDDKFLEIKETANIGETINNKAKFEEKIPFIVDLLKFSFELVNRLNFQYLMNKGINVRKKVPELNIGRDGYPNLDTETLIEGYDLELKKLIDNPDFNYLNYRRKCIEVFPKFNITHILELSYNNNIIEYFSNEYMSFNGYINNIVELVINYYQYKDQLLNSNIEYENSNDNKIIELYDDGKIRNATLIVSLNGETHSFEKVTFSFGGYSSLYYGKPGFNIKIRKRKNLYGRSQFKLRSDYRDATFLRSKLVCDMHNRLGLPSISANYVQLYVNNEDLGLYVLMDAYKLSWAELQYDDEKTETLYQCKDYNNDLTVDNSYQGCINENKDVIDESEWYDFLTKLSQATDVKDIEDIFDVDQFLYEMAFEYLLGSWDHFLNYGHNFYVYRPKNQKKFQIMLYDFDAEFGQDIDSAVLYSIFEDIPNFMDGFYPQYPFYRFKEWAVTSHLINILILKDTTRFNKCLKTIVEKVFNPATLFPHIDKLKKLIKPYVEKGKIPDNNGKYIGIYNDAAPIYSLKEWDANSEFTTIETASGYRAYGIKYWILAKYGYVCKIYDIKCDSSYINGNYQYSVDKSVESDENYSILNKSVQKNNNSTIEFSLDPNLNLDQEENTDNNSNSSSTIIHTTLKFLISIYILLFVLF